MIDRTFQFIIVVDVIIYGIFTTQRRKNKMLQFIIGLVLGAIFGVAVVAVATQGKDDDN